LRKFLNKKLAQAGVSKILLDRLVKKVVVTIHTARPGVVIGKKGNGIEKLRAELAAVAGADISLNIVEIRKPDVDAKLVAESIATQIEKRVGFRRAVKRAMQSTLRAGAAGIRVNCSGRLGGAEIARMEWYREGQVPLQTLRSDIEHSLAVAHTTYGTIGVKVWINKGETFNTRSIFLPRNSADRRERE
jgi:small subunit ribosomal protein S3